MHITMHVKKKKFNSTTPEQLCLQEMFVLSILLMAIVCFVCMLNMSYMKYYMLYFYTAIVLTST